MNLVRIYDNVLVIFSCFDVFNWEIVANWNLNEKYFNCEECLSEDDKELLSEEVLILKHSSQNALNDVLLNDDHENNDSEHVSIWEGVVSLGNLVCEFLIEVEHVDDHNG